MPRAGRDVGAGKCRVGAFHARRAVVPAHRREGMRVYDPLDVAVHGSPHAGDRRCTAARGGCRSRAFPAGGDARPEDRGALRRRGPADRAGGGARGGRRGARYGFGRGGRACPERALRLPLVGDVVADGHRGAGADHYGGVLCDELHQRGRRGRHGAVPEEHHRHVAARTVPRGVEPPGQGV